MLHGAPTMRDDWRGAAERRVDEEYCCFASVLTESSVVGIIEVAGALPDPSTAQVDGKGKAGGQ